MNLTDALMHSGMPGTSDIKTYSARKDVQSVLTFNLSSVQAIAFPFVLVAVSKAIVISHESRVL